MILVNEEAGSNRSTKIAKTLPSAFLIGTAINIEAGILVPAIFTTPGMDLSDGIGGTNRSSPCISRSNIIGRNRLMIFVFPRSSISIEPMLIPLRSMR